MIDTIPALLTYSFQADPDPIEASSADSVAYAALSITVENGTNHAIQVTSIAIGLAVGTNAKDFASNATGIGTVPPTGWNATVSGDSLLLTPVTPDDGKIEGASVTCLFTGIQVNQQPGQVSLPITEVTVDSTGASRTGTGALTVIKVPPQFTLGPLTVMSPNSTVVAGGTGVLQWSGGAAAYSLSYNPTSGPTVTVSDLPQIDTFTTVPLELIGLMGFTLNVSVPIPGSDQTLPLQRTASITVVAATPVITSFTGVVQNGQAAFTWTTENATSCQIAGSAVAYEPNGTTPFMPIPDGTVTLTAYNADGVASVPAHLYGGWTLSSTLSPPVDQYVMAIGSTGTEIFVVGNWFGANPGLLVVISSEGTTLRQTNLGQAGNVILFSPDYTRLYIALANEVVAVDPQSLNVIATAAVPNQFYLAISPDGTKLYSATQGGTQVYCIDTSTMTVSAQAPYLGAENQGGLAIGFDGKHLFGSDNDNSRCFVWDAATLGFITTVGVDSYVQGIAGSPTLPEVYLSTGPGNNVNVIDTTALTVAAVIPAGDQPYTMAATADGTRLFVVNANWQAPAFTIIDTARRVVTQTTSIGTEPEAPVFSPADSRFYSTVMNKDGVLVFDVSMLAPESSPEANRDNFTR